LGFAEIFGIRKSTCDRDRQIHNYGGYHTSMASRGKTINFT